ncbi:DUF305 domain-containing protein [Sphingobium sp. BHU LFT2]|uniref:DUF305 domain-containing protein n=1 Tax=Sphingobium sp. BHU LFT2 TaxID=2807634 RepID=UPI001BE58348|nr:DUF305 domain-containing protein [Sphingobium sp. BHU LFT2]MBT2246288.1 DUF305 domain-containing protein [Sphingobium sp. BHU LFT2]
MHSYKYIATTGGLLIASLAAATALAAVADDEAPYLADIKVAMDTMMSAMDAPPSGDVDRDFVAMMLPHHQGAIDMAVAQLRYGKNPQLKRIAQEIIVDQQQEIAAMKMALGDPLPAPGPVPTQPLSASDKKPSPHHNMSMHEEHRP